MDLYALTVNLKKSKFVTVKSYIQIFFNTARRMLEELPKATPPSPRKLTDKELKKLQDQEEQTLRELRIFLRDVLNKLGRDRKFSIFTKPVDVEEVYINIR